MKSSSIVVTVVAAGGVLIAAYAVGLLIRQARVGDPSSSQPSATEVNEPGQREDTASLEHRPGGGGAGDAQQARAKLKQKRAEALEKMESATEEEKAEFRKRVRDRVSAPSTGTMAQRTRVVHDPNAQRDSKKSSSDPNRAGDS